MMNHTIDAATIAQLRDLAILPTVIGRESRQVLRALGLEVKAPVVCGPQPDSVQKSEERARHEAEVSGDPHPSRRVFMDVVRARVLDACRRYVEFWTRVFTIAAKVIVTFLALSGAVYWFAFFAR